MRQASRPSAPHRVIAGLLSLAIALWPLLAPASPAAANGDHPLLAAFCGQAAPALRARVAEQLAAAAAEDAANDDAAAEPQHCPACLLPAFALASAPPLAPPRAAPATPAAAPAAPAGDRRRARARARGPPPSHFV